MCYGFIFETREFVSSAVFFFFLTNTRFSFSYSFGGEIPFSIFHVGLYSQVVYRLLAGFSCRCNWRTGGRCEHLGSEAVSKDVTLEKTGGGDDSGA